MGTLFQGQGQRTEMPRPGFWQTETPGEQALRTQPGRGHGGGRAATPFPHPLHRQGSRASRGRCSGSPGVLGCRAARSASGPAQGGICPRLPHFSTSPAPWLREGPLAQNLAPPCSTATVPRCSLHRTPTSQGWDPGPGPALASTSPHTLPGRLSLTITSAISPCPDDSCPLCPAPHLHTGCHWAPPSLPVPQRPRGPLPLPL